MKDLKEKLGQAEKDTDIKYVEGEILGKEKQIKELENDFQKLEQL